MRIPEGWYGMVHLLGKVWQITYLYIKLCLRVRHAFGLFRIYVRQTHKCTRKEGCGAKILCTVDNTGLSSMKLCEQLELTASRTGGIPCPVFLSICLHTDSYHILVHSHSLIGLISRQFMHTSPHLRYRLCIEGEN